MKTSGLSLAEAHASGRKHKRPEWETYFRFSKHVVIEDAAATDYELEPEVKLFTREEVEEAVLTNYCNGAKAKTARLVVDALFDDEEDV